jgi:hypothetical protein
VRVRWPLVLVLVLLVAGCGGGGGSSSRLSKQEYASKADAICAKGKEQTRALATPTSLKELADTADKTIPIIDKAISDLRKLKPPADEQTTADEWLAQWKALKGDLAEIRDKAKDGDAQGVQSIGTAAQAHSAKSNQLATQLGMSVCNKD